MIRLAILIFLLVIGNLEATYAQEDTTHRTTPQVRVETKDGSQYYGQLIKQDRDRVILRTESVGVLEIPLSGIANIQFVGNRPTYTTHRRPNAAGFTNPNPYRYLFFPSAYTIPRGELQYQSTYVFLQSLGVGITDNFSVSGGIEFISTLTGNPIVYIAPKVGFPITENFRLGAGGIYINGFGILNFEGLAVGYAIGTIGNQDRNASVGLGYASFGGESAGGAPVLTMSGMLRVGRHLGLVTENWFSPTESGGSLLSLGLRIMGQKVAGDIAFFSFPLAIDEGFFLPYLSVSVKM